jgi:hypothetical protein
MAIRMIVESDPRVRNRTRMCAVRFARLESETT